jgi:hypothetical protein
MLARGTRSDGSHRSRVVRICPRRDPRALRMGRNAPAAGGLPDGEAELSSPLAWRQAGSFLTPRRQAAPSTSWRVLFAVGRGRSRAGEARRLRRSRPLTAAADGDSIIQEPFNRLPANRPLLWRADPDKPLRSAQFQCDENRGKLRLGDERNLLNKHDRSYGSGLDASPIGCRSARRRIGSLPLAGEGSAGAARTPARGPRKSPHLSSAVKVWIFRHAFSSCASDVA